MQRTKQSVQELAQDSFLDAASSTYVEGLYEQYCQDPNSVDAKWQGYFSTISQSNGASEPVHSQIRSAFKTLAHGAEQGLTIGSGAVGSPTLECVKSLMNSFRYLGHFEAELDPLKRPRKHKRYELTLEYHGLSESDLETKFPQSALQFQCTSAPAELSVKEVVTLMRKTYCSSIASEYMYIVCLLYTSPSPRDRG